MTSELIDAVSRRLPAMNQAVLSGALALVQFAEWWSPLLLAPPSTRDIDGWVWAQGMVRSSLDRHAAVLGVSPQLAAAVTPPDADLLRIAVGRPPREVIEDYLTRGEFLGMDAERLFRVNAMLIPRAHAQALDLLEPLTDAAAWDSADTVERIDAAQAHLAYARQQMSRLARSPVPLRREFADLVRGFYRPRQIGGLVYDGINAAHLWSVVVTDMIVGCADDEYRSYADDISRHFLPGSLRAYGRTLALGSLAAALAERLGVNDITSVEARAAAFGAGPRIRDAVTAYARLCSTHAGVSGAHGGVIRNFLLERATEPDRRRGMPLGVGSGGRPHEETERLHDMRRAHAASVHQALAFPIDRKEPPCPSSSPAHASSAPAPSA
ncbi:MAG: hypothetical protein QOC82_1553 [Frankiaceae bacterium]|jgi:hypothetical protein|nr:hypothetical protein [Frankiaceae bacterium]